MVRNTKLTARSFYQKIIEIIRLIPQGRVATYGQIAALAGNHRASRQVARALHSASEKERLPWQRVVNSSGKISLKRGYGYELQKKLLLEEGIRFGPDDKIDFDRYLWKVSLSSAKQWPN